MSKQMFVRVALACQGENGPTFAFCVVRCTPEAYANGDHYDLAADDIEENTDLTVEWTCDENDPAARCIAWPTGMTAATEEEGDDL